MRRMLHYQKLDYVEGGDLICFGISEHETKEAVLEWSDRAKADIDVMRSHLPKTTDMLMRPVIR